MDKKLSEAAREVARARKQLGTARRKLARYSRAGTSPHSVLTGEWKRADEILSARRKWLLAQPGVVGVGLGHRHRAGIERTEEVCVTVFVDKKLSDAELRREKRKPLPSRITAKGQRIAIDVIKLGKPTPHGANDVIGSIGHKSPAENTGTIGAIAIDLATKERVLLTAGHVAKQSGEEMTVPSTEDGSAVSPGEALMVIRSVVDAAKIRMAHIGAVAPFLPPGTVAGWRPVSDDVNTVVRMYGRTSHGQSGVIKFVNADVYDFKDTLLVHIQTDEGDSGAAILDNANLVLGFLFGLAPADLGDFRVFCPASLVLERLGCDIKPN